jgi:AcrR family transcriptional regulator
VLELDTPARRTPKGGRSADRLLEAATTVLARDGFGGATLGRIADEAGMDKRSIAYYYGSREALLVQVVRRVGERLAAGIEPPRDPAADLSALVAESVDALWAGVTSEPELARAYFSLVGGGTESAGVTGALLALKAAYIRVARDQISAIEAAGWPPREPRDGTALLIVATLRGLLLEWTESGENPALQAALDHFKTTLARNFARPGG